MENVASIVRAQAKHEFMKKRPTCIKNAVKKASKERGVNFEDILKLYTKVAI